MPALTACTATTSGTTTVVMTSAVGSYDIDEAHGVLHISMGPPVVVQNGGPDDNHTYVVRGLEGGTPRAFVGMMYVGTTSTGMARYSYNFSRMRGTWPEGQEQRER
jgi:hypothetical protein